MSVRDPLTGAANRRQLITVLEGELDRVARSGDTALLLMIDVDHFKNVNDCYGHNVGDQALQHVTRLLRQCVRPMDTMARYGGEEFAIVLPACQPAYGKTIADRIRQTIEHNPLRLDNRPVDRTDGQHWRRVCTAVDTQHRANYRMSAQINSFTMPKIRGAIVCALNPNPTVRSVPKKKLSCFKGWSRPTHPSQK